MASQSAAYPSKSVFSIKNMGAKKQAAPRKMTKRPMRPRRFLSRHAASYLAASVTLPSLALPIPHGTRFRKAKVGQHLIISGAVLGVPILGEGHIHAA